MKAKIIMIAALATMMVACTSDETSTQQTAPKGEGIPFSATITTGSLTRALTEATDGKTIDAAWADGEQVALIYGDQVDVMDVTKNDDGTATIGGNLTTTPDDGSAVTVVYPASAVDATTKAVKADLLTAQDGLLATIASKLDLRQSSGATFKVAAQHASLNGTVALATQLAIVKFSLQNAKGEAIKAKSFVIKDGAETPNVITTVTPADDASDLYVAMRPASAATFNFAAAVGTDAYTYTKTGVTLAAATYYQSPLKMTFTKRSGEISFSKSVDSQTWSATAADNTYQLAATVTGDGTVTYSVNDDNTCGATIDAATGVVTFLTAGTVTVSATVADSETYNYATKTVTYTLTVNKAAGSISFEAETVTKKNSDSAFMSDLTIVGDGTVTYSSSDSSVATVNSASGLVTIVGPGTITITATVADGTNYTYSPNYTQYTLTVKSPNSVGPSGGYGEGGDPINN
jgi:hypothetical protein